LALLCAGALAFVGGAGCDEAPLKQSSVAPGADAGPPIAGLSADQAARVVARVDDRNITLGDFARTLERMDQFDRLRYQSKERRRELLEEMIDVQLLAGEAKRRGLDKDPEAQDAMRMILRDALLADSRLGMVTPAQITDHEVRAYFEGHPEKFSEPERRRVAAIVVAKKDEAAKVLKDALKVKSPVEWGDLWFKNSLTAPKVKSAQNPAELAGDLGIVGPVGDPRGANPKVPEPVRAAAFKLKAVNEVATDLVESEGRWFIVRLNGLTQPHRRSLAESDRAIRVLLVQEKMAERERALEDELRQKFPVEIDEAVLAGVKVPAGAEKAEAPGPEEAPPPAIPPTGDPSKPAGHDGRK
jgi:EpsD family peptidyl-prolyl cis-trans isomerase